MRSVFVKTSAIIMTLLILILPVQFIFNFSAPAVGSSTARADPLHDIKVYFHRGGTMDTTPPDQTPPGGANVLRNGDGLEFLLTPSLYSDLRVVGKGKVDNKDALQLVLDAQYHTIGGTASITINVIDDSQVVATKTYQPTIETSYGVPFVGDKTEHTFSKGSVIKVNITAQTTGAGSVTITYDTPRSASFLYLTCDQIVTSTLGAFHSDGSTGEFMPNARENRIISFKGTITDALGGYDIDRVALNCQSVSVFPSNAQATINAVNEKAIFYFNWSYPYGIKPGQYTVTATITDNSNNSYSDTTTFTMAAFGVALQIVEPEKSGEKGQTVVFDLEVTNIGGSTDSYRMSASPTISWATAFDKTILDSVSANKTEYVKLNVNIPVSAADNQQNSITITAISQNEASKADSQIAIATALATTEFTFVLQGAGQKEIAEGESAKYSMRLTNIGDNTDAYAVIISDDPSSGWQVTLDGGTPVSSGSSYIRKEVTLTPSGQATFTLTVWASGSPMSSVEEEVVVTAFPKNDTSKYREVKTVTKLLTSSEISMSVDKTTLTSSVKDKSASTPEFETLVYSVNIQNLGGAVTLTFDVSLPSSASGWLVNKPADISLDENEDKDLEFRITPKSGTAPNEGLGYELTLRASSVSDSSVTTKATVYAKVEQFYKLEVNMEENKIASGSSQVVTYILTIRNLGNGEDKVSVLVNSDWDYTLSTTQTSEKLGEILVVTLPSGVEARVSLTLTSPADARNGDFDNAQITVRSKSFDTSDIYEYKEFQRTTTVEKVGMEAFMDSVRDLWILIILVVALIIIAVFLKMKIKDRQSD